MDTQDLLHQSIQTGFIDQSILSNKQLRPSLLTNDPSKGIKVLSTILRELEQCDEFWFSVAFITTSGVAALINTLLELEHRSVKGKILASDYLDFTHPEALRRLRSFKNIELRIASKTNFHSKGYLFRKDDLFDLIIGSSNLTQSALSTNKEWNLKISAKDQGELIEQAKKEFSAEFRSAKLVDDDFLFGYHYKWHARKLISDELNQKVKQLDNTTTVEPNKMQREALVNIQRLREQGKNKALLISATGTGKTFLSAFDVQRYKPKRFLFLVHRLTIAEKAKETFESLLDDSIKMGIYSGGKQEKDADYIFSTIQTISRESHLKQFSPDHFDYIVIDETHRAAAKTYQTITDYFSPKFLLGMTATPERTDGGDIFKMFDHNIAYEIRLNQALKEEMLSPFHYYGVTDLTINGAEVDEFTDFNLLTANERVNRIIETSRLYGCDDGNVRGLVFCSRNEIASKLSEEFNTRGYNSIALSGSNSENDRQSAIDRLESDDANLKLDYIFTVDIFNEGVDMPRVNQIIMLRPTQSAIIFVQQLGRGLRKISNKDYLTVIDFIGNYSNNYLVPIALYGDTSYNKDTLRKLMASGSSLIPGASTINFDRISKEKIFTSIDSANMQLKKDLVNDYNLLKYKLGYIPMMVDFLEHGSRDPQLYATYSKSYFNFVCSQEPEYAKLLNSDQLKLLELFTLEINNAKRIEETIALHQLILKGSISVENLMNLIHEKFHHHISAAVVASVINNLNFGFVTEREGGQLIPVKEKYGFHILNTIGSEISFHPSFSSHLKNPTFKDFLVDSIHYASIIYDQKYNSEMFCKGFSLYQKYSRKDVFRILNWEQNPVAQNVGGYIISTDKTNCPIFVNYHKEDHISSTTKYEDHFSSPSRFHWMTKSRRNLGSNDVVTIKNYRSGLRLPLFIKKSNDEGKEFYYMGDITPIDDSFEETTMKDDKGNDVSVVKIEFKMNTSVADDIYEYIIH